jgi:membrane fusion protein
VSSNQAQNSLYRPAALEAAFMHKHGKVLLLPAISHVKLSIGLFLICTSIASFVATQTFQQKASVSGYLESTGSAVSINSKESTGIVAKVLVKNGQFVNKDTPLLSIERAEVNISGKHAHAQRLLRLQNEEGIMDKMYEQRFSSWRNTAAQLATRIKASQTNLSILNKQLHVAEQQRAISEKTFNGALALNKQQLVAQSELDQAKLQVLNLTQNKEQLLLSINQEASILHDLTQQQSQHELDFEAIEHELAIAQLDIQTRRQSLNESGIYTVYSPTKGEIHNLYVKAGDNLNFQQALLQILPKEQEYEAVLHVPNKDIGFVEVGQDVEIKLDAFSFQKYGSIKGKISLVSKQTFTVNKTQTSQSPSVYIVKVALLKNSMRAKGEDWPLKAGMHLSANIVLDEPTLLEYLLAPLKDMLGAA